MPDTLADPALARGALLRTQMQALRRLATMLQSPEIRAVVGHEALAREVLSMTQQSLDALDTVSAWLNTHA